MNGLNTGSGGSGPFVTVQQPSISGLPSSHDALPLQPVATSIFEEEHQQIELLSKYSNKLASINASIQEQTRLLSHTTISALVPLLLKQQSTLHHPVLSASSQLSASGVVSAHHAVHGNPFLSPSTSASNTDKTLESMLILPANLTGSIHSLLPHASSSTLNNVSSKAGKVASTSDSSGALGAIRDGKKRMQSLANQLPNIMEILEIPLVLENCIKNGYFEEAMELLTFFHRISFRYANVNVISNIAKELVHITALFHSKLVQSLAQSTKLHTTLHAIGHLRRLGTLDEAGLRLLFLKLRYQSMMNLLEGKHESSLANNDASEQSASPDLKSPEYLKSLISVTREQFFETISHYRSIFNLSSGTSLSRARVSSPSASSYSNQNVIPKCPILDSFIVFYLSEFQEAFSPTLEGDTGIGDMATLSSLSIQTMYLGMSLGRLSLDLRTPMSPIFLNICEKLLVCTLTSATQELIQGTDWSRFDGGGNGRFSSSISLNSSALPPAKATILAYSPLANYANTLFSLLNAYAQYPCKDVLPSFKTNLTQCLGQVQQQLAAHPDGANCFRREVMAPIERHLQALSTN